MNEDQVEQAIQSKGLTAPRITPEHIDSCILTTQYYLFPGTTTIVCCITLNNGYTVIGKSACASPANFDEGIGEHLAFESARKEIWALEGYLLREKLYTDGETI